MQLTAQIAAELSQTILSDTPSHPAITVETSPLRALTHSGLAVLGMRPDRIAKGDEKLRLDQSNASCGKFARSESSSRSLLGSIPMYRLGQVEIEGWVS